MATNDSLSRKEKLKLWKEETGRTPMKRLSYVCEYWDESSKAVVPQTTSQNKSNYTTTKVRDRSAGRRNDRRISQKKESVENRAPGVKAMRKRRQTGDSEVYSKDAEGSRDGRQPSRRELLEEWSKVHGSTVNKPHCHPSLTPSINQRTPIQHSPTHITPTASRPIAMETNVSSSTHHTTPKFTPTSPHLDTIESNDLLISVMSTSPAAFCSPGQLHVNRSIEHNHSPYCNACDSTNKQQQLKTRRSHVRFLDQSAVFCSTAIFYTDLKRRTKQRVKEEERNSDSVRKSLVWVTPVRRTTRRSRGGRQEVIPSAHVCDSPSDFSKQEGGGRGGECEVVMVPNLALKPLLVE